MVQGIDGKYYPIWQNNEIPFKTGIDEAIITKKIQTCTWINSCYLIYKSGFHFWTNKEDAEKYKEWQECWHFNSYKVIECTIKKSWITAMGKNEIDVNLYGQTVVTNKAIFPKCS